MTAVGRWWMGTLGTATMQVFGQSMLKMVPNIGHTNSYSRSWHIYHPSRKIMQNG